MGIKEDIERLRSESLSRQAAADAQNTTIVDSEAIRLAEEHEARLRAEANRLAIARYRQSVISSIAVPLLKDTNKALRGDWALKTIQISRTDRSSGTSGMDEDWFESESVDLSGKALVSYRNDAWYDGIFVGMNGESFIVGLIEGKKWRGIFSPIDFNNPSRLSIVELPDITLDNLQEKSKEISDPTSRTSRRVKSEIEGGLLWVVRGLPEFK